MFTLSGFTLILACPIHFLISPLAQILPNPFRASLATAQAISTLSTCFSTVPHFLIYYTD